MPEHIRGGVFGLGCTWAIVKLMMMNALHYVACLSLKAVMAISRLDPGQNPPNEVSSSLLGGIVPLSPARETLLPQILSR